MVKMKSIVAFIAGFAGGAAVSMLAAPHSGKVTRSKLKTKYEEERDKAEEKAAEYRDKLRKLSVSSR